MKLLTTIFLTLFLLTGCTITRVSPQIQDTPSVSHLQKTIQYDSITDVAPEYLSLDIYYPSDTLDAKPVVMYVHGGGWSIGDKEAQLDNKISLFEDLDYIFVSINYRLSPFPFSLRDDSRVQYPIHNQDTASAISWVVENIGSYGGDSSKIALMGHSAGAHIVSLIGTDESFLQAEGLSFDNISGVISIDTEGYDVKLQAQEGNEQRLYENAFGDNEANLTAASPLYNVSADKNHPPFFIGERVAERVIGSTDSFIQALSDNDISVTLVNGSIYSHAEINDAIGNPQDTIVTPALIDFLEDIFK